MSEEKSSNSVGIGFFGLLGIVFITLKLTHQLDWPWIWITTPLWGPVVLVMGITGLVIVFGFLRAAFRDM